MSVIVRLRTLAKDAALAAFASSKPGRVPLPEQVELAVALAENDQLSEALKEDGSRADYAATRGGYSWA